jgi:hypothetical protein
VYQRCPAGPESAPFGAYVIQAKKITSESQLTSANRRAAPMLAKLKARAGPSG